MSESVRRRERACGSKCRHRSKEAALAEARSIRSRDKVFRYTLNVYRCRFCGCFHVGNSERRQSTEVLTGRRGRA